MAQPESYLRSFDAVCAQNGIRIRDAGEAPDELESRGAHAAVQMVAKQGAERVLAVGEDTRH
jgi:hypothetical protein